jgi:hypothetical protein
MIERGVFVEGYKEGWRLVMGDGAPVPDVPFCSYMDGSSSYKQGFTRGMKDAAQKQFMTSNQNTTHRPPETLS